MGFRGEALPSIASVSRFTLTTCERDGGSPEATQIIINGGKILEVKVAGSAPGTAVEVRQIFQSARAPQIYAHRGDGIGAHSALSYAGCVLAHPGVTFTFSKDGRLIWQPLPAVSIGTDNTSRLSALRERMRAIQGGEQKLLAVDFSVEISEPAQLEESAGSTSSQFRVWGFMGAPGVSRSTREDQHLFVNRRPVENRGLNFALLEGYHTSLMKGRFPVCCLFLEIDPAAVDINIHPAKREVKFHQEAQARRLVTQAVRETLLKFHAGSAQKPASAAVPAPNVLPVPETPELPQFTPPPPVPRQGPSAKASPGMARKTACRNNAPGTRTNAFAGPCFAIAATHPTPSAPVAPVPLLNVPLRLVGVIGRLYVVASEPDRGLVLLDQHAAHERILFLNKCSNRLEQQGERLFAKTPCCPRPWNFPFATRIFCGSNLAN